MKEREGVRGAYAGESNMGCRWRWRENKEAIGLERGRADEH
jgi:hypothetical protein